mmetsp:Transcript_13605/g.23914  ORF Transcript_13605/g.23914 Transcript_13605/m.23914 type:complete len:234 (-) Transcript_13605:427-1128(-)
MRPSMPIDSHSSRTLWNKADCRYLSPKLGRITTTSFPLFSGLCAIFTAAAVAAPELIPHRRPSSSARRLAISIEKSEEILMISSQTFTLSTSGTKPAPMPWILCAPGLPPERMADSAGSTATTWTAGFIDFRYSPVPVMVPPVPTPLIKKSTCPAVSRQISGPVVRLWTSGLAGFSNCCRMKLFAVRAAISLHFSTAPRIPLAGSVSTSWAPKARSSTRRSRDIDAGMVRISL